MSGLSRPHGSPPTVCVTPRADLPLRVALGCQDLPVVDLDSPHQRDLSSSPVDRQLPCPEADWLTAQHQLWRARRHKLHANGAQTACWRYEVGTVCLLPNSLFYVPMTKQDCLRVSVNQLFLFAPPPLTSVCFSLLRTPSLLPPTTPYSQPSPLSPLPTPSSSQPSTDDRPPTSDYSLTSTWKLYAYGKHRKVRGRLQRLGVTNAPPFRPPASNG